VCAFRTKFFECFLFICLYVCLSQGVFPSLVDSVVEEAALELFMFRLCQPLLVVLHVVKATVLEDCWPLLFVDFYVKVFCDPPHLAWHFVFQVLEVNDLHVW
jgi:hypothetical protein